MGLDPERLGYETEPRKSAADWDKAILYALGVGAKRTDLDFLYEGRGPKILPTFAVVPALPVVEELFRAVGGDVLGIVHGAQAVRLTRPFVANEPLVTRGKVAALYDLKRMAEAIFETKTCSPEGELIATTEWSILYRFDGGFGGSAPPRRPRVHPPERAPDFEFEETTSPEQALLYRLSGDLNPLHADPDVAARVGFEAPILHGLCTYGFVGRAVLQEVCEGDAARLNVLVGQFRKPVFPGETLIVEGWRHDGRVVLRGSVKQRSREIVFSNAYAEVQ